MGKFIAYILSLSFILVISGCNGQDSSLSPTNPKSNVSVITFDVYKGGLENGLSIIYLSEQASLLIKSTGKESLDFQEIPPPPLNQAGLNDAISDIQEIKVETINLEASTIENIESLVASLGSEDLSSLINNVKTENGVGIKIVMLYSDNDTKDFTLINGATENQRNFLRYIFDRAIEKSKYNKEQLKIFLR